MDKQAPGQQPQQQNQTQTQNQTQNQTRASLCLNCYSRKLKCAPSDVQGKCTWCKTNGKECHLLEQDPPKRKRAPRAEPKEYVALFF